MALSPGNRLGDYEVPAKLGEGGMGEVYRARDTRLGPYVALKIPSSLPAMPNGSRASSVKPARWREFLY